MRLRFDRPRLPALARAAGVAMALVAALSLAAQATPAAAATRSGDGSLLNTAAPNYVLQGIKWTDRTRIDVYYTWGGGACVLGGQDLSGPASVTSPAIATAQLQAAITDINAALRGALTLQLATEATRTDLCGRDAAKAMVVGWGAFTGQSEDGLAITSYQSQPVLTPAPITLSRIFIRSDHDLGCTGVDPYRDLRHFMLHELLHGLGLGHTTVAGAIMEPVSTLCQMSSKLQPDDIAALNALYPPPPGPSTNDPATAGGGSGVFAAVPAFSTGGQAQVVFLGGSIAQLETAARNAGARGIWAQQSNGTFQLDVIGGPTFVNDSFRLGFASGFAGVTAVTLTR